jgi:hypothetical protein
MRWEIPNYDSLRIEAAPEIELEVCDGDLEPIEFDMEELEACLRPT